MSFKPEEIEQIGQQLRDTLQTDVAIIDKYGFILSSSIKGFEVNSVISPKLLEFINDREQVAEELNTEKINSMVVSITGSNLVFSFGDSLIIMSKVPDTVNLAEFLPAIHKFLGLVVKETVEVIQGDFEDFNVKSEIDEIDRTLNDAGDQRKGKFAIFSSIVQKMSKLK